MNGFQVVIETAESGDAEAKFTAGKYFIANHIEEESERAVRWIREAADAGLEDAEEYIENIVTCLNRGIIRASLLLLSNLEVLMI